MLIDQFTNTLRILYLFAEEDRQIKGVRMQAHYAILMAEELIKGPITFLAKNVEKESISHDLVKKLLPNIMVHAYRNYDFIYDSEHKNFFRGVATFAAVIKGHSQTRSMTNVCHHFLDNPHTGYDLPEIHRDNGKLRDSLILFLRNLQGHAYAGAGHDMRSTAEYRADKAAEKRAMAEALKRQEEARQAAEAWAAWEARKRSQPQNKQLFMDASGNIAMYLRHGKSGGYYYM